MRGFWLIGRGFWPVDPSLHWKRFDHGFNSDEAFRVPALGLVHRHRMCRQDLTGFSRLNHPRCEQVDPLVVMCVVISCHKTTDELPGFLEVPEQFRTFLPVFRSL
jgi:hypothetical protein